MAHVRLLALLLFTALLSGRQVSAAEPGVSTVTQAHALGRIREAWTPTPRLSELPIGVFDSGTGGLAVLEETLRLDAFDNRTGEPRPEGDGQPDFARERFVFLADQANMPYGNYAAAGRAPFLRELVLCDAAFLLSSAYFRQPADAAPAHDRRPVKALAIACNTATAYGRGAVEALVARTQLPVVVLGVIDAGAEGVVDLVDGPASIGVLATQGTVASGAYPAAIAAAARQRGGVGPLRVFQQGTLGLAGAIDGAAEFVAPDAQTPRADYRGPSLTNPSARIERELLPRYGFDFSDHRMLVAGDPQQAREMQLNAVENYVAYDVTRLVETLRAQPDAPPLAAVVLGCTHFPYVAERIAAKLRALRDYQEQGRYVYRNCLREKIALVDPARYMACKLFQRLANGTLRAERAAFTVAQTRGEFFLTVGWPAPFSYDYKYGRGAGYTGADVRTVPLTPARLDASTAERLRQRVPHTWRLLDEFSLHSAKCQQP
jgi:glutamate racemase